MSAARAFRCIAVAGLAAGVLDILYVIVYFAITVKGVGPTQIFHGIAAGLLGAKAAREGGAATAALGLGLHFVIALGAAAIFYAASRRWKLLLERAWITGPLYGVGVWLVMNLVVLPLSATPPKSFPSPIWFPVLIAHLTCVGLPIALLVRRGSR